MGADCVRLAKEVGYVGAGTIECLMDNKGNYFFMEMNTRIQVEHCITEEAYGVDLVKEQIKIAAGEPLSHFIRHAKRKYHAIECRVNAEDPYNNFQPSPGRIDLYYAPGGRGVRIDSHAYAGYTVPPHYDSMVGKLIIYRHNRKQVLDVARRALQELTLEGITTTAGLFLRILDHSDFRAGDIDTGFIDRYFTPR
jgi:acetyl-CoA carboxylase biotin carboxylase subunit